VLTIQFSNYRAVFIGLGLVGILLFASPTIALLIKPPAGQTFSEIYLLGPDHTLGSFPFNVQTGVQYLIYLGVSNDLGTSGYYQCYLKFGNYSNSLPDSTSGTPSSLPALYEYRLFLANGATWETPLTFEVNDNSIVNDTSRISSINVNGLNYPMDATSTWNSNKTGYYYTFVFELWLFNDVQGVSQYDNRFVSLVFNMTQ
jgi:uncharacterized membrane protein